MDGYDFVPSVIVSLADIVLFTTLVQACINLGFHGNKHQPPGVRFKHVT